MFSAGQFAARVAIFSFSIFYFSSIFAQTQAPTRVKRPDASSDQANYFSSYMKFFARDPAFARDQIPPKFDRNGKIVSAGSKKKMRFEEKIKLRELIKARSRQPFSEALRKSQVENFFLSGTQVVRKIEQMGNQLLNVTAATKPWSGDYWPTYRGGIAARYADPLFPSSADFKDYDSAYRAFLPLNYQSAERLRNLSPAEKYDILVGDESFSLTKWSFDDARDSYTANANQLEAWFGLCHGWAPAAFMLGRPENSVDYKIENFQGQDFTLKVYPDDVKALSSLLWANTTLETFFLGGRCNTKNPAKDANGRITDEDCYDVNPGAWHMALVNKMGLQQQSFVIDATFDYEVWNQPVVAYEVAYFHPQTRDLKQDLSEALVPIEEFTQDKFKKYRSPKARFIVGVNLTLSYVVENAASHAEKNSEKDDFFRSVQYIYDLELNENGEIIGGEWYQNVHPDFIWAPEKRARAVSIADRELRGEWTDKARVPTQWTKSAAHAATYGQPLATVVEGLIKRAKK